VATGDRAARDRAGPALSAAWVGPFEALVLVAATPALLFPTVSRGLTVASLSLLGITILVGWLVRGRAARDEAARALAWPATPFNAALLVLMLTIPVGVWASVFPDLTLPKLTGLILGIAAFRLIAWIPGDRRNFERGIALYGMAGLAIWGVGMLGVGWTAKIAPLSAIVAQLPRLLTDLPGTSEAGINANNYAGALTPFLPLAAATVWSGWCKRSAWRTILGLVALLIVAASLVLAQSRSAWLGGIAGLAALCILAGLVSSRRWVRRAALLLPVVILVAAFAGLLIVGPARLQQALAASEVSQLVGTIGLSGRGEIWQRAIYAIQDFPFTGVGLGAFRRVVHLLYPLFAIGPEIDIAHAHNIFLQVGLDLGLVGLAAYIALLLISFGVVWSVMRRGPEWARLWAIALAAGLIGLHVFGLTDALALGSKPGIAFWMALGLIAALPRE
jgi:putative inorganic carbon (HCO3(-)) transporter